MVSLPKMNSKMLLVIVVGVLIFLNFLIFSDTFSKQGVECLGDICFYGKQAPLDEYKLLVGYPSAIIVAEGDLGNVPETEAAYTAFVSLTQKLGRTNPTLVLINYQNNQAVDCNCTYWNGSKYAMCEGTNLEFCETIKPVEFTFLIRLKFPSYPRNEVHIDAIERTIEVRAKSGAELLLVLEVLDRL